MEDVSVMVRRASNILAEEDGRGRSEVGEVAQDVVTLGGVVDALRTQLAAAQRERDEAMEQVRKLTADIVARSAENALLRDELQQSRSLVATRDTALEMARAEFAQARIDARDAGERERAAATRAERAEHVSEARRVAIERMHREADERAMDEQRVRDDLRAEVERLRTDLNAESDHLKAAGIWERRLRDANVSLQDELDRLRTLLDSREDALEKAGAEIAKLLVNGSALRDAVQHAVEGAQRDRAEVDRLKAENAELRSRLSAACHEGECSMRHVRHLETGEPWECSCEVGRHEAAMRGAVEAARKYAQKKQAASDACQPETRQDSEVFAQACDERDAAWDGLRAALAALGGG